MFFQTGLAVWCGMVVVLVSPLLHEMLREPLVVETSLVQYWLPATMAGGKGGFRLTRTALVSSCIEEPDMIALLSIEANLPPDVEIGSVSGMLCKAASVDANGYDVVSTLDKCKMFGQYSGWRRNRGRKSPRCWLISTKRNNFFLAHVRLRFVDTFDAPNGVAEWSPLLDPRTRAILGMDGDSVVSPLVRQPCDDRTEALSRNMCMRGAKGTFVASSLQFSGAWRPYEIVLQCQVRMHRMLRAKLEGGPGSLRLVQQLGDVDVDPSTPASVDLTVDWNRISEADEHPTVWISFRARGSVTPYATFTFVARVLEDCRSHALTLHVHSGGVGTLYIDYHERARFVIGTPANRFVAAAERSASLAAVPFLVREGAFPLRRNTSCDDAQRAQSSTSEDGTCASGAAGEDVEELCSVHCRGKKCLPTEECGFGFAPFLDVWYSSITLSGWGIAALASRETAFGLMPWSFDNVYVGESLLQAREQYDVHIAPTQALERALPTCPYNTRS